MSHFLVPDEHMQNDPEISAATPTPMNPFATNWTIGVREYSELRYMDKQASPRNRKGIRIIKTQVMSNFVENTFL